MKKIIRLLFVISITLFSFYYTNKSIEIIRNVDPIMKQIEVNQEKFKIKSTNAKILDNTIVSGEKGKEVDKNLTYNKMKQYGTYNESLTTIKEVKPTISIDDYYDKYVVGGNEKKKQVSLLFKINDLEELKLITNYLNLEQIKATLLIKDSILDEVGEELLKIDSYQIELLYEEVSDIKITSANNYLYSILNKKNKYCYTEEENEKLLNICKKHKMHTIIPTFVLNKNPTKITKEKLKNGAIIGVDINSQVEKELDYIVYYIKSRGYNFVRLATLLKE